MIAKLQFGLALLALGFILVNPLGACVHLAKSSPAHACCPKVPVAPRVLDKGGCICLDAPRPVVTAKAATGEGGKVALASTSIGPDLQPQREPSPFASVAYTPPERFLTFHQLLI